MKKLFFFSILIVVVGAVLSVCQLLWGQTAPQYPIADKIADKLIQKYQTSTCQQLAQEKQQPPSAQKAAIEQKAIETLHNDPQLRKHFLDRIAAPVVDKMFECRFVP